MALVKVEKNTTVSTWSTRDKKATSYQVPADVQRPVVDYGRLRELLSIEGLSDSTNSSSTDEAHSEFIERYNSIFVLPEKMKGLPVHSLERSMKRGSETTIPGSKYVGGPTKTEDEIEEEPQHPVDRISHDIREHTSKLRVKSRQEKKQMEILTRAKSLSQLAKKLPYERTAAETEEIFQHLTHFSDLADQVSSTMLRELCVMAYLETWKDPYVPVFGNTGWHILLKGTMRPQQIPWKRYCKQDVYFPNPSPEPLTDLDVLGVGESFGTLEKVADREGYSRILTVTTLEPNCEFLKITTADFERVSKQLSKRDETEKINLLQSCSTFSMWAQQPIARSDSVNRGHPLVKVANVLEWVTFPANTILVSEGYQAPFIGIIKSGNCHVLRQVEVMNNVPKGKTEKKLKQVVMGTLGPHESFGEVSLMDQKPMTCSIISASEVHLGSIAQEKLSELDETTKRLLHQSSEPTFGNLSKDDIHREYAEQEMKREWNQFKHKVVLDVINSRGVRPGHGKWAK